MKAFKIFVLGLFYGLLIKFAIDRIYRDNEIESIRSENASLKEHIRSLETKLPSKPREAKSVTRAPVPPDPVRTGTGKDDLKTIKGIGPVIEKKLNDVGVTTFEALSRLTVEELEQILGRARRLAKEEELIAQAAALAQQNNR